MGIGFKQFCLESDVVFEGNYRNAWTFQFQMKKKEFQMKKKERYVNSKWTCWSSNLSYFRSENGCGKWHFLVWKRVRIWRNRRHTPTKNSQEQSPHLGEILILFYLILATINNYWIPLSYYLKNIIIKIEERPRRITPSKITIILQTIRKPNLIILSLFIQNNYS